MTCTAAGSGSSSRWSRWLRGRSLKCCSRWSGAAAGAAGLRRAGRRRLPGSPRLEAPAAARSETRRAPSPSSLAADNARPCCRCWYGCRRDRMVLRRPDTRQAPAWPWRARSSRSGTRAVALSMRPEVAEEASTTASAAASSARRNRTASTRTAAACSSSSSSSSSGSDVLLLVDIGTNMRLSECAVPHVVAVVSQPTPNTLTLGLFLTSACCGHTSRTYSEQDCPCSLFCCYGHPRNALTSKCASLVSVTFPLSTLLNIFILLSKYRKKFHLKSVYLLFDANNRTNERIQC